MLESLTLASVNEVILWLGENPCKAEKKKKNTKWNTSRNTSRNMMCFSSSFQLYKDFILITTKPHHWGHARESLTLASVNEAILWLGENPWKAEKKKKSTSCFYCSRLYINLSKPRENKGGNSYTRKKYSNNGRFQKYAKMVFCYQNCSHIQEKLENSNSMTAFWGQTKKGQKSAAGRTGFSVLSWWW